VPPLPWWCGFIISPQADTLAPRFFLGKRILSSLFFGLFLRILLVVPRQTQGKQRHAGIQGLRAIGCLAIGGSYPDAPDGAPVAVPFPRVYTHFLAENHIGHAVLCNVAEGLLLFRGIDSGKAYFVLLVLSVEEGDRVAVRNGNNSPLKAVSQGTMRGEQADQNQPEGESCGAEHFHI